MSKLKDFFKKFNQPYDLLDFFLGIIITILGAVFLPVFVPLGMAIMFGGLYVVWRSSHAG